MSQSENVIHINRTEQNRTRQKNMNMTGHVDHETEFQKI